MDHVRPHSAEPSQEEDTSRRKFLERMVIGLGSVTAMVLAVPLVAFLLAPVLKRRAPRWQSVGLVEQFKLGETVKVTYLDAAQLPWAGYAAQSAAWLSRDQDGSFLALSSYCTHTGCPVRWERGAELFLCPCHGGVFRRDGTVAAGPPPRPLPLHQIRVRRGQVELLPVSPLDGAATGGRIRDRG